MYLALGSSMCDHVTAHFGGVSHLISCPALCWHKRSWDMRCHACFVFPPGLGYLLLRAYLPALLTLAIHVTHFQ